MSVRSASRIAVSQFVLFALLTYTFVTLGVTIDENSTPGFSVNRRSFYGVAGCFALPMVLSMLLLYGILRNKPIVIRGWLIFSILLTVVLLFVLLSGAIYLSVGLNVYWGILLCVMPFVLTFWMAEGTIVIFSFLKKLENKFKVLDTV